MGRRCETCGVDSIYKVGTGPMSLRRSLYAAVFLRILAICVANPAANGINICSPSARSAICNRLLADRALETLELGLEDAIAVSNVPDPCRRRLRTTKMMERLIEGVRRREKVIGIFLNDESAWRLVGGYLAERYEAWSTTRRCLKMQEYHRWSRPVADGQQAQLKAAE